MHIKILNPKGCNPDDIKRTTIQENGATKIISTYPNGFSLTIEQDDKGNFL